MTPGVILGILVIGLMLVTAIFLYLVSEIQKEKERQETEKRIKKNDRQCEPWFEQFIDGEG